jgi:hypothetical protein
MKIFGGEDNDEFVVYHNLAPLILYGDDGDDSFLIRAFALVGSQEDLRERTDVSGGAGADLVRYAVNAPVNIDGGDGFDTVIVIGTEFNDDFVLPRTAYMVPASISSSSAWRYWRLTAMLAMTASSSSAHMPVS